MPFVPAAVFPNTIRENCEAIGFQYAGGVQSHAVLFVLNSGTRKILQVSESVRALLGVNAETLLGQPLDQLFEGADQKQIVDFIHENLSDQPTLGPVLRSASGSRLVATAHVVADRIFLELEAEPQAEGVEIVRATDSEVVNLIPNLLAGLAGVESLEEATSQVCNTMRECLRFDQAMLYRFDKDWNGEVIGEARRSDSINSYLGLRFPATDIPRSARDMYTQVSVRVTHDTADAGSRLVPLVDPENGSHPDLTRVRTRISAEPCRTFYQNMGVRSVVVLPLIIQNDIWGHISFFNSVPRWLAPDCDRFLAAATQAFASVFARIQLEQRIASEALASRLQLAFASGDSSGELAAGLSPSDQGGTVSDATPTNVENEHADTPDAVMPKANSELLGNSAVSSSHQVRTLRELLKSDSLLLSIAEQVHHDGAAIPDGLPAAIIKAIAPKASGSTFQSDCLSLEFPELAEQLAGFAGCMVVRIDRDWRDYLILLRKEQREETFWAGDPKSGVVRATDGAPELTPRNSFERYLALAAGSSRPWSDDEERIASSCAMTLGLRFLRYRAQLAKHTQAAFLANMSHEIRTPMTAILGFVELLDGGDDPLSPRERGQAIRTIRENAEHLLTVINDILDISKIDAGKMTIECVTFEPIPLVREVVRLLEPRAIGKGLSINVVEATELPSTIHTDPTRLRQILINIAGNAIKFTELGKVDVVLAYDPAEEILSLQVIDTGIGMDVQQLELIRKFDAFTQADVSTTRNYGGTGLGLSISKSLCKLLGGELGVDSTQGQGTVFTIAVKAPAGKPDQIGGLSKAIHSVQGPATGAVAQLTKGGAAGGRLSGRKILLAEDGPDNQRLFSFHLKKAGAEVVVAENGRVAVETMQQIGAEVDLILMDMQMPKMDGYQATQALREEGWKLPIIGLTAHAMSFDQQKCLDAGCDRYESKPISKQKLIQACLEELAAPSLE